MKNKILLLALFGTFASADILNMIVVKNGTSFLYFNKEHIKVRSSCLKNFPIQVGDNIKIKHNKKTVTIIKKSISVKCLNF